MKKAAFILIFVLVFKLGFSQGNAMNFLPILFDTVKVDINHHGKRLEVRDSLLSDTLRIVFRVTIEFQYPLSDTTNLIKVENLKLTSLDVKFLTTKRQYSIDLLKKNKWSVCQRDIWNRYSKIINYWYWNQPYEKMIYKQSYGNKAYFVGVLYGIPR